MPPGAIGQKQLERRPDLCGYFQPVQVQVPEGALVALAEGGNFSSPEIGSALVGLQVGSVYRLRVSDLPGRSLAAVYPTIEMIDRLHPPPGKELRFPVPIEITTADIALAAAGQFVARVIYVEDPQQALPERDSPEQRYFEVLPDEDPLVVASQLGRPIAILRMGSLAPDPASGPDAPFTFGSPPWQKFATPLPVGYVPTPVDIQTQQLAPPDKLQPLPGAPALTGPGTAESARPLSAVGQAGQSHEATRGTTDGGPSPSVRKPENAGPDTGAFQLRNPFADSPE
jgi:hypothetical protein